MKKLSLLLVTVLSTLVVSAHAGDVFYATNQLGGFITLTDNRVNCDQGWEYYYATDQNGNLGMQGCYRIDMPWVKAIDNQGHPHQWASTGFNPTEYAIRKYNLH